MRGEGEGGAYIVLDRLLPGAESGFGELVLNGSWFVVSG